jgi:hypothetical protein
MIAGCGIVAYLCQAFALTFWSVFVAITAVRGDGGTRRTRDAADRPPRHYGIYNRCGYASTRSAPDLVPAAIQVRCATSKAVSRDG